MYYYKNIGFRPVEECDLELLRINRNDSGTLLNIGGVDLVNSLQQIEWWKAISKSKSQMWFCIVEETESKVIGVLRFQNIDIVNKCCEIGADVFKQYRGKGYGFQTYEMALEYLFKHFNMHTVYLRVTEFNEKAINLYSKVGFEKTGVIPQSIFRFGKYWDNIIMSMTFTEYEQTLCK